MALIFVAISSPHASFLPAIGISLAAAILLYLLAQYDSRNSGSLEDATEQNRRFAKANNFVYRFEHEVGPIAPILHNFLGDRHGTIEDYVAGTYRNQSFWFGVHSADNGGTSASPDCYAVVHVDLPAKQAAYIVSELRLAPGYKAQTSTKGALFYMRLDSFDKSRQFDWSSSQLAEMFDMIDRAGRVVRGHSFA